MRPRLNLLPLNLPHDITDDPGGMLNLSDAVTGHDLESEAARS